MFVIIANHLHSGFILFQGARDEWVDAVEDAAVLAPGAPLDAALERARRDEAAHVVIDPQAIEITLVDGRPGPVRLRERIRVDGPTTAYGVAAIDLPGQVTHSASQAAA